MRLLALRFSLPTGSQSLPIPSQCLHLLFKSQYGNFEELILFLDVFGLLLIEFSFLIGLAEVSFCLLQFFSQLHILSVHTYLLLSDGFDGLLQCQYFLFLSTVIIKSFRKLLNGVLKFSFFLSHIDIVSFQVFILLLG